MKVQRQNNLSGTRYALNQQRMLIGNRIGRIEWYHLRAPTATESARNRIRARQIRPSVSRLTAAELLLLSLPLYYCIPFWQAQPLPSRRHHFLRIETAETEKYRRTRRAGAAANLDAVASVRRRHVLCIRVRDTVPGGATGRTSGTRRRADSPASKPAATFLRAEACAIGPSTRQKYPRISPRFFLCGTALHYFLRKIFDTKSYVTASECAV